MKILTLDIETSPLVGYAWGEWDTNIIKVLEPTRMLCVAAKWTHEKKPIFLSEYHDGRTEMLPALWELMDEADVVVHYNGQSFDIKHINREFWLQGFLPYSPFKQIDLLLAVRKMFKFSSNKLDRVAEAKGIGNKIKHEGFSLWEKCLAGDAKAWDRMKQYNIQDVKLTEQLYHELLPWLPNHPNRHLYGESGCPSCGSQHLQRRGFARTAQRKFQQYQCQECFRYFRDINSEAGTTLVDVVR